MSTESNYLTLAAVAQRLPGRPSVSTVYRWATRGILSRGNRVRLDSVRVGGRRFVRAEALAQFVATLSMTDDRSVAANEPESQRRARLARELEEIGI